MSTLTWRGARLVVGVSRLERLVNVLLPVADGAAGVDAGGSALKVDCRYQGLNHGEVDGLGDSAGSKEDESFQL